MKRWWLLLSIVACGSGCGGGSRPTFSAQADQVVNDLAAGQFSAVAAKFDQRLRASLSVSSLSAHWSAYQQLLGRYRSHGSPTSVRVRDLDVERVPVTMAKAPGEIRVTFDRDGTIGGLFFLRAGLPPP